MQRYRKTHFWCSRFGAQIQTQKALLLFDEEVYFYLFKLIQVFQNADYFDWGTPVGIVLKIRKLKTSQMIV